MTDTSDAAAVLTFTRESGTTCPDRPKAMNRTDVEFIIRMIFSELDELACTVTKNEEERNALLANALATRDCCKQFTYADETSLIAAQFDALVDSWYYSLNVAARHGVNMSRIFNLVHAANMAKRDPATGKFLRRESDGKIIKPAGWTAPDVEAEIQRQTEEGSWSLELGAHGCA